MWRNLTQPPFQHGFKEHIPLLEKSQDSLPHGSHQPPPIHLLPLFLPPQSHWRSSAPRGTAVHQHLQAGSLMQRTFTYLGSLPSEFSIFHATGPQHQSRLGSALSWLGPPTALAVGCKRTHLLPARGHCDCIVVTMGDSGVTQRAPWELPWMNESHSPAGTRCRCWSPLCHPFPSQKKCRNPNLLFAPSSLFNILPPQTASFFVPCFAKFSNWFLQYFCDLSEAYTSQSVNCNSKQIILGHTLRLAGWSFKFPRS